MQHLGHGGRGRAAVYATLCLALWVALLMPRGLGWHSVAESLWTEDSTIFLNQVYGTGVATLWTSYQGYLHTFQRLFCLLVAHFPLATVPYLLSAGWCIAFAALVFVLDQRLGRRGIGVGWVMIVLTLIALQPSGGEVYFSITNTQWVLGLALALYVCLPEPDSRNPAELLALAVVCLTGPFSILLLPIVFAQVVIRRDVHARWRTYCVVAGGAVVQLSVLLHSNRLTSPVATGDTLGSWFVAAGTFFTFGATTLLGVCLAVVLWVLAVAALLRAALSDRAARLPDALYLLAAAGILFGVSLYSVSLWSSVTSISPLSGGGRYYFIPYGLFFTSALMALRAEGSDMPHGLSWIYAAAAFAVCALLFHPDRRQDLQWPAFAEFASAHPGVEIPINPQWNFAPTWKVVPSPTKTVREARAISIPVPASAVDGTGVVFSLQDHCRDSRRIGIEAEVVREGGGYAMVQWGDGTAGGGAELQRFYLPGSSMLQLAFTKRDKDIIARMVPLVGSSAVVKRMDIFCL